MRVSNKMLLVLVTSIFVCAISLTIGVAIGLVLGSGKTNNRAGSSSKQELYNYIQHANSINNPLYRYEKNIQDEKQRTRDINELVK